MNVLAGAIVKLLTWLGTIFLIRKGAKDAVRADTAEATLETATRVVAPLSDPELERVRKKYRRD